MPSMHAITSIEVENFRCFKKLSVDGLTQVNLIVGANNAGKTALHRLEAGRETSIRFDAGRVAEYVAMELEAR
jgi:predicted ATPase